MEIPGTKHFIPKEFELGTTLSWPIWSIDGFQPNAIRSPYWCITQQQIMAHDYDDDYDRNQNSQKTFLSVHCSVHQHGCCDVG